MNKNLYCNNCVISIYRPGMIFNSKDICFPCITLKNKKKLIGVKEEIN